MLISKQNLFLHQNWMRGSHLSFERFTPTSSTSSICCIWQPVCNKWIFTVISKYICLFLTTLKLFFYIYSNSFTYLTFCEGSFHIFSSFLSSWMSFCFLLMSRNMYDYYKYKAIINPLKAYVLKTTFPLYHLSLTFVNCLILQKQCGHLSLSHCVLFSFSIFILS